MDTDDIFNDALNLESKFYDQGYAEGLAHGRLHGLYEGRQLGQEKAWEVWDEVGFYEGFARVWEVKLGSGGSGGRKDAKALQHCRLLLGLIARFPTFNPSQGSRPVWPPVEAEGEAEAGVEEGVEGTRVEEGAEGMQVDAEDVDMAQLLSSIRARYRLLCTSVGARPRLLAAGKDGTQEQSAVVEGIEGPMKGVDTRQLRF